MVSAEPLPEPPEPKEHHQSGQRSSSKGQDPPPVGDSDYIPVVAEERGAEYGLVKMNESSSLPVVKRVEGHAR